MSRSWWTSRPCLALCLYVGVVFSTVPVARDVVLALRNNNLLGATVTAMYGVVVALVVYHVFFDLRHSDFVAFLVVAALISAIAALLLGVAIPEERVHFLQYGVMALLAHRALVRSDSSGARSAALGLCGAFAVTSALGLADECFQSLLPSRRFDWSDVSLNTAAAALALALDELLYDRLRLRARFRKPPPVGETP